MTTEPMSVEPGGRDHPGEVDRHHELAPHGREV